MELLLLLLCYLLLVLIGSIIINGIYIITRGDTIERPDGKMQDVNDMLLYPLYKFIMKEAQPPERMYYTEDRLADLYRRIASSAPMPAPDAIRNDHLFFDMHNKGAERMDGWIQHGKRILESFNVNAEIDFNKIKLYEEKTRYRFSKYIRKPTVECLKCMSSFWGTIIWWSAMWVIDELGLLVDVSGWVGVVLWLPYLVALTWTNTYLFYAAKQH